MIGSGPAAVCLLIGAIIEIPAIPIARLIEAAGDLFPLPLASRSATTCPRSLSTAILRDAGTILGLAAGSLFRKATGEGRGAVTAAIFWLQTRARWKETHVHEHEGNPDSPLDIVVTIGGEWTSE